MTETVDMSTRNWKAVNTGIRDAVIDGEPALRVVKGEAKRMRFDENTYARLPGEDFHNGTIEVRMRSRLAGIRPIPRVRRPLSGGEKAMMIVLAAALLALNAITAMEFAGGGA